MATLRQRMAVEKIVENGGNVSRAMLEVGYGPGSAKTPQKLTDSKGFKELLKEYGLTESFVTKALVEDIKKKPQNRVSELRLASDILKMSSQDSQSNIQNNFFIFNEEQQSKVARRITGRISINDSTGSEESN